MSSCTLANHVLTASRLMKEAGLAVCIRNVGKAAGGCTAATTLSARWVAGSNPVGHS